MWTFYIIRVIEKMLGWVIELFKASSNKRENVSPQYNLQKMNLFNYRLNTQEKYCFHFFPQFTSWTLYMLVYSTSTQVSRIHLEFANNNCNLPLAMEITSSSLSYFITIMRKIFQTYCSNFTVYHVKQKS